MKCRRAVLLLLVAALGGLFAPLAAPPAPAAADLVQGSYKGYPIENCADPAVTGTKVGGYWYMYCTADPLHDKDKTRTGGWNFHLIPILRSADLHTWEYVGDVFSKRPRWVAPNVGLWAPDIQYFNGKYYLYYSAAGTVGGWRHGQDSAIGVATSTSPTGPWTDSGGPVVEKQADRWVIDPFVIADDSGQRYIFYGTMAGGLFARPLSATGLSSDKAQEVRIAVPDRYEGAFIVKRGGYYYLFASATNCCNVGLTAYSVFVGRAGTLLGPYVDRQGAAFRDSRVGGTPVLSMNGNRWVGPGHNAVINDGTQDWFVYHAVDRLNPHFAGDPSYTKRPPMVDPLDWTADGWPVVRHADDPAAPDPATLTPVAELSDDFDGSRAGWGWAQGRTPATAFGPGTLGDATTFSFAVQDADLWKDRDNAAVRIEGTPDGDYVVETRLHLPVPPDSTDRSYVQAGLVIYGDDDNYVKLVHVAIGGTRQTEFAKEIPGGPQYGSGVVGVPSDWTYLRIVRRANPTPIDPAGQDQELYTAYTSTDGATWVRGGTWTHTLGPAATIGLVAMGGSGYTADFDYVRVYTVAP